MATPERSFRPSSSSETWARTFILRVIILLPIRKTELSGGSAKNDGQIKVSNDFEGVVDSFHELRKFDESGVGIPGEFCKIRIEESRFVLFRFRHRVPKDVYRSNRHSNEPRASE